MPEAAMIFREQFLLSSLFYLAFYLRQLCHSRKLKKIPTSVLFDFKWENVLINLFSHVRFVYIPFSAAAKNENNSKIEKGSD